MTDTTTARAVRVERNEYPDAIYSGQTISVILQHNRHQWSVMTLTPTEATALREALAEHLATITAALEVQE